MTLNPPAVELEPEDIERMANGKHFELIDGHAVEKIMGAESDELSVVLGGRLAAFARAKKLGRVYGTQTGYKGCFPNKPKQLRKPDVSFVAEARLPGGKSPRGDFDIAPDLVAEIVSPNDTYEEIEDKVTDYRSAGVKLIWVVNPKTKTVLVRRLDRTCAELGEADTLDGENVVPGFTCPVADLFA